MFILYIILFLGGFYLFGAAFTVDSWPMSGWIFTAGVLVVSAAVALLFRTQRRT